jgi:hypothetical protein
MDEREAIIAFVDSLDKWAILCGILVALGVVGESIVGYLHWTKGNRLHVLEEAERLNQQKAVEAARADAAKAAAEVADATRGIEEAKRGAAEANARAAEANQKAEEERLARVKIEERLAPRTLTAADVAALERSVAPFAGTEISLQVANGDEPTKLANSIIRALEAAHWKMSVLQCDTGGDSGIVVEVVPDADDGAKAAAHALVVGLSQHLHTTGPIPSRNLTRSGIGYPSPVTKPVMIVTIAPK